MITLGVNFGHDASLTVIQDGKIIYSVEEEKTSRIKQDFGWPVTAWRKFNDDYGIHPKDVDIIAFGSNFYRQLNKNEIKYRFRKSKGIKYFEYADRISSYLGLINLSNRENNYETFKKEILKLGFTNANVVFYNHHLCHAASAYFAAPFKCDLIITADGHGDGESITFYRPNADDSLKLLKTFSYEVSIGQFYSAITQLLGFRPTRHEGKITGLAAYGKETSLVNEFSSIFKFTAGELKRFPFDDRDTLWADYMRNNQVNIEAKINFHSESEIGVNYVKNGLLLKEYLNKIIKGFRKEDIAFACQKVTENIMYQLLDNAISNLEVRSKIKLGLAGGVFANVRVNQVMYEHPAVENIFIQPAMGDSGLSLGAAILAEIDSNPKCNINNFRFVDTYKGPDYTNDVDKFIESIDTRKYSITHMRDKASELIAKNLADNKIIGLWHGSMEWGPRALGNRSLILNTFDRSVNDTLNKRLNRTEFMPFAPSVLDTVIKTYMPKYSEECPAADYMTITYDVDPKYHEILQAVVHVDGTARPQVVKRSTNPFFYDIITEFYKLTGCGAIVNTSFNAHEEPIVSSPLSAFSALVDDRIDILILDKYMIVRKK